MQGRYVNASHRKLSYFRHAAGARQTVDATVCGFPSWRKVSERPSGVTLMRLVKPAIKALVGRLTSCRLVLRQVCLCGCDARFIRAMRC